MNKAVFLDRDGTINTEEGYLTSVDEFRFLPKAVEALKLLSKTDYKIIVVTNQSGVARGYLSEETLKKIHGRMRRELMDEGARIDGIYYCPHHPDEKCGCRKPNTGLIEEAGRDFDLNLKESYVVGDSTRDIQTGLNAGCKTILVETGYGGRDGLYNVKPDHKVSDLLKAVEIITK